MDLVIKEVHGINDNDEQFILAYEDDIAQTAATKEELEKCITTWNTAFTTYQLKFNLLKTEVMVINRTPLHVTITLHDIEIKKRWTISNTIDVKSIQMGIQRKRLIDG